MNDAFLAPLHPWPRWWRIVLIGLSVLVLSSCRQAPGPGYALSGNTGPYPALPPDAFGAMAPEATPPGMPPAAVDMPRPEDVPAGPWAPPGMARPWPQDEYLADGGDSGEPAGANRQGEVLGLDLEDTVAQYDTLDGRTLVEPTNRVHIYSPRFLSVRQVVSLCANEQLDRTSGLVQPERAAQGDEVQRVAASKQHFQAIGQVGQKSVTIFRNRQGQIESSQALGPQGFQDAFLPFENFRVIRLGRYDEAEMPFLARSARAAITWTDNAAVQVILDGKTAVALVQNERVEVLFTVKEPPAQPKLRVIKVASTPFAEPGETVDFTIRFDNVGNQPIGNVTLLDNLSARLEYVEQSAQSSVKAHFSTQPNQGQSLVLHWDLVEPLKPGEGGIVRFSCRVR